MFKILKFGLSFLFLFGIVFSVQAVSSSDVVINEITWMGTTEIFSANFVFAAEKIDINTASLEDLLKIIHIGEVRVLELISLRPFSSLDELVRIKGIGKKRIEDIKKQGLAWVSATEPEPVAQPEPQPLLESSDEEPENLAESGSPPTYPSGILINEILPSPEGTDSEEEWIEIFNKNDFEINLSDWEIKDAIGRTKTYTFPKGTKILANGFLVLKKPITKITLNNNGDGVLLIQPDGKITDEVSYEKASHDQSYNRVESGWVWDNNLTPGSQNIIPASILKPEKETEEGKTQESTSEKELAAISKQIPKKISSLIPLFIASGVAIFSGIIILILKKTIIRLRPPKFPREI